MFEGRFILSFLAPAFALAAGGSGAGEVGTRIEGDILRSFPI